MSDILSPAVVAAIADVAPKALVDSHEALRKHARMGWELAMSLAARLDDPFIARATMVQYLHREDPGLRHNDGEESVTVSCSLEWEEVA